jgi:polyhydroxyalkanoate synthase
VSKHETNIDPLQEIANWLTNQNPVLGKLIRELAQSFVTPDKNNQLVKEYQNLIDEHHKRLASTSRPSQDVWFSLHQNLLALLKTQVTEIIDSKSEILTSKEIDFLNKQISTFLESENFFIGNREAVRKAIESNGKSLSRGLDYLSNELAVRQTHLSPPEALLLGKDIACTPGKIIFQNHLFELIQYSASTKSVKQHPILIVPPFINKYYVLDLRPENSLVRFLVNQGMTVFMISWKNPSSPRDGAMTWNDYVHDGVHQAIRTCLNVYAERRLNIAGYCVGGTLTSTAIPALDKITRRRIASLTLFNTLIDYSDAGELSCYVNEHFVAHLEQIIGQQGIFPGHLMNAAFSSLKPRELIWNHVQRTYLLGNTPPVFDLLQWNGDMTNVAGPALCYYLRNMYLENKLVPTAKSSKTKPLFNFDGIDCPKFIVASINDHIVPWNSALESAKLFGNPCKFVLSDGGHVAGIVNSVDFKKTSGFSATDTNLDEINSSNFHESSSRQIGSWWPTWIAWLAEHSGKNVRSRQSLGKPGSHPISNAPGQYVREKCRDAAFVV